MSNAAVVSLTSLCFIGLGGCLTRIQPCDYLDFSSGRRCARGSVLISRFCLYTGSGGSFLASLVFVRSAKLADEYYVRAGNLSFGERRSEPEEGCTMSGVKGVHGGASV